MKVTTFKTQRAARGSGSLWSFRSRPAHKPTATPDEVPAIPGVCDDGIGWPLVPGRRHPPRPPAHRIFHAAGRSGACHPSAVGRVDTTTTQASQLVDPLRRHRNCRGLRNERRHATSKLSRSAAAQHQTPRTRRAHGRGKLVPGFLQSPSWRISPGAWT